MKSVITLAGAATLLAIAGPSVSQNLDPMLFDRNFGADGIVRIGHDQGMDNNDTLEMIAATAAGTVVCATVETADGPTIGLTRVTDSGTLDSNFGVGGQVNSPAPGTDQPIDCQHMIVTPNGRVIVVGTSRLANNDTEIAVMAFRAGADSRCIRRHIRAPSRRPRRRWSTRRCGRGNRDRG